MEYDDHSDDIQGLHELCVEVMFGEPSVEEQDTHLNEERAPEGNECQTKGIL